MAVRAGLQRLFVTEAGLRAGWRILLFLGVFVVASVLLGGALAAAFPLAGGPALLLYQGTTGLGAALAAGGLLMAAVERRPFGALGFAWTRGVPRELALGLGIGCGAVLAVGAALAAFGLLGYRADPGTPALYASAVVGDLAVLGVAAAGEEALFRGYPFQVAVRSLGPVPATVVGSALFAAAHAFNPHAGAFALLNIFLAGVLLSVAYLRTRSLWFATALHLGWNWGTASVLDLPVSGLDPFDTPLYEPVLGGAAAVTGGAFGPEGGLAGTVGFLLALAAVRAARGLAEAPEMHALGPLVDVRLHGTVRST